MLIDCPLHGFYVKSDERKNADKKVKNIPGVKLGHSIKNPYRGWTNLSRFKNFLEKIRIPPGKMPKFAHTPWKENF